MYDPRKKMTIHRIQPPRSITHRSNIPRLSLLSALIVLTAFALSCHSPKTEGPPLFQLMDNTGIHFSNDVKNRPDFNIFTYRNFYNGGGVAIGDINNDGLPDIFFTSNMGANKLYLNKGKFQF